MTGAQLRRRRGELGLSRPAFGRVVGASADLVGRWERGDLVAPEAVALAVEALERRAACVADSGRDPVGDVGPHARAHPTRLETLRRRAERERNRFAARLEAIAAAGAPDTPAARRARTLAVHCFSRAIRRLGELEAIAAEGAPCEQ